MLTRPRKIKENLGKAMIAATNAAEGETKLSGGEGDSRIDSNTAQHISWAATEIVEKIINKSHVVDSCISLLNKFAKSELEPGIQQLQQNLKIDEAEREQIISEKNKLEMEKVNAETAAKRAASQDARADLVQAKGDIELLSVRIGQLHERLQLIDKKGQNLKAVYSIRSQCIEIIEDHLQKQKELRKSLSSS